MTFTLISAALALMFSPVDALVENALQVEAGEITYTTFLEADGTYTTTIGISGTWTAEGGELCVTRSTGEHGCQPLQDDIALGSTWQGTNPATGEAVTYTVIAR